ncbi:MAG: putative accessory processing protein [uncultured Paraburkholderia sp.]|nr:MAG: putative accessory processing protein [uncultured Paraburkholderia sp.]CAH2944717.1 MAG: putative accessory processing protein [uncultured Paraburkholderia sp.]
MASSTHSRSVCQVCKRVPEVFERIDGALFERVGMPVWATAGTTENYIAAAVRMI